MTLDKLVFVDKVMDSVYGYIDVTKVEREIIALPIFKRLHMIKQLSLVDFVFPSAVHTRFSHSLGVMYMADAMAVQLGLGICERQKLRLAALLHDIGHYPLAHVGEKAYLLLSKVKPVSGGPLSLSSLTDPLYFENALFELHYSEQEKELRKLISPTAKDIKASLFGKTGNSTSWHHETVGAKIINENPDILRVVQECLCDEKRIVFSGTPSQCDIKVFLEGISNIVKGSYVSPEDYVLVQLLHSELDADRLDYMKRDSIHIGTNFGADLGTLIKNLEKRDVSVTPCRKPLPVVGIKEKGVAAADQFLINRFFNNRHILGNRHILALEFMAFAIIVCAYLDPFPNGFPKSEAELTEMVSERSNNCSLLGFTDLLFWKVVREYSVTDRSDIPGIVKSFSKYLSKYQEVSSSVPHANKVDILTDLHITLRSLSDLPNYRSYKTAVRKFSNKRCHRPIEKFQDVRIVSLSRQKPFKNYLDIAERKYHGSSSTTSSVMEKCRLVAESFENRLLESIVVFGKEEEGGACFSSPRLLIDCKQSLIHSLSSLKSVEITEFNILFHDKED